MAGFANVAFMDTPLVTWIQTYRETQEPLSYKELCDGVFLNYVMHEIDPRGLDVGPTVEDVKDRLTTWDILLKNIKTYYKDVLQQHIVMRLPNISVICRDPETERARKELGRVLLLVLGCAVQCERKEEFIENIKQLDIAVQHAIVENIQEITDDHKNVFAIELPEDQVDEVSRSLFTHLTTLIQEREGYVEEIKELSQTLEELYLAQQQAEALKTAIAPPVVNNTTPEKQHMNVELAEAKARVRKLRQELEEKSEMTMELQEELSEANVLLNKLRAENSELIQDARSARTYRDEVDILKEKANRVDKLETEITKYKEKLNELEFYKTRVEELREDNSIIMETKNMLEDQLSSSQLRIDTVVDLENELIRLKQHIGELTTDRDEQRHKLQEVLEENARLDYEKKSSFNESANLEEELMKARTQLHAGVTNSLSTQLGETANAKILRLELENQRLMKRVEDSRQSAHVEQAAHTLELEKENHRLAKKVEKLQEGATDEQQRALQMVVDNADLQRQKVELEKIIETIRESSERQVRELEREKDSFSTTIVTLRERNEKTMDLRLNEIEKENKRMHENVTEMTSQVSQLEYEKRQLVKSQEKVKESVQKCEVLDEQNVKFEKECIGLKKSVATLKLTCDSYEKLEQQHTDLQVENQKLNKMVVSLKSSAIHVEELEQQNINLTVERQALKRNLENIRNNSSRLADLEQEKVGLEREIQQLKKVIENLRGTQSKQEQLETDLLDMDTENQRLQRALEAKTRHVEELENENMDMENQMVVLTNELESVRVSVRRLEALEGEHKNLEKEITQVTRDKSSLDKENKRLKQNLELKAATVDEVTSKVSILEKENKEMVRQVERLRDGASRVRELEKESLELVQQTGVDKRTLSTLREDLVNEKIRTQQLTNELDKLNHELERVGINKDKLTAMEHATAMADESKFLALEGLMQEALNKKMELKEQKITSLQSRLEESVSRNQRLQEELTSVRRDLAILQQRHEEDALVRSPGYAPRPDKPTPPPKPAMIPNSTKDILELKDHLITVERKNASLETENRSLMSQVTSLQERLYKSESQTVALRQQLGQQHQQFSALQSQLAKCQVEISTLQAKNETVVSQKGVLQKQHTQLEVEHEQLMSTCEELQASHATIVSDHDALQQLHEQLTSEYEALISEHGSLKANHKALRVELKDLQDQHVQLQREKQVITDLKYSIEQDRESLKTETKSFGNLQLDFVHVKQENIQIKSANDKFGREYSDLAADHKQMKAEFNQLQLKYTSQQGALTEARNQLNMNEIDMCKLVSKCESLGHLNTKLEEENRTLMMQLQALLNQNQELLTQALESKDHFHEEERAYMEKLSDLRRQKEQLEDKIIEQYKRYDPVKRKSRGFGENLLRKARGLLSRNRSRERNQTLDSTDLSFQESPENSSLGSGSMGETNESPSEKVRNKKNRDRRSSAGDLLDSPHLGRQNKVLAQSTTALNVLKGANKMSPGFSLRGAKSTENLLTSADSPRSLHRQGDGDSVSSGSNSAHNPEWPSRPAKLPLPGYDELIELKNSRQRQLFNSSSGSVFQNNLSTTHGSQSSEDNTQDGGNVREPSVEKHFFSIIHKTDEGDEDEEDDSDLISLNQFLTESNRSPASRRKLLVANRIDPESVHTSEVEVQPEPPAKFLTPRSPIIEKDPARPKTPKNWRRLASSKSEANISQLSRQTSGSSLSSSGDRDRYTHQSTINLSHSGNTDLKTSTPKYALPYGSQPYGDQHRVTSHGSQPYGDQRRVTGHGSQHSTSDGRLMGSAPDHPVYATIRQPASAYNAQQRAVEYNGYERDRDMYNDSLYSNNNLQRKVSDGATSNPRTPNHGDNLYKVSDGATSNPRTPNHGDNLYIVSDGTTSTTRTPNHGDNLYKVSDGATSNTRTPNHGDNLYKVSDGATSTTRTPNHGDNLYTSLPRKSSAPSRPNGGGHSNQYPTSRDHYGNYMSIDAPVWSGSTDRDSYNVGSSQGPNPGAGQPDGSDMNSQYNPGNVRNLLQSFQMSVHNQSLPSGVGHPKQPPVPPPRRTRPLSAGGNMGGSGSAFSVPRPQSAVPNMTSFSGGQSHSSNSNNNNLISDGEKGDIRPGSTPPRPNPTGREGPPNKSSVWYEYGCI